MPGRDRHRVIRTDHSRSASLLPGSRKCRAKRRHARGKPLPSWQPVMTMDPKREQAMIGKAFAVGVLVLMTMVTASAVEIGGVTLPETLVVGSEPLVLNGAGLRKKFFIKVYAAGLYLGMRTDDPRAIIDEDAPMAVRMEFIYDGLSPEKLIAAWNEGFAHATGGDLTSIEPEVRRFDALFTAPARKGDVYQFLYTPGAGVRVEMNGRSVATLPGLAFKRALFAIWLGEPPADRSLKQAMLGE